MAYGKAAFVVVALASTARMLSVHASLGPVVASHFDFHGRPDAYLSPGGFLAVYLLILGLETLLVFGLPAIVARIPVRLINLPHREYWLAPGRRDETVAWLGRWFAWLGAATMAFLAAAMEIVVRANLPGGTRTVSSAAIGILVAVYLGFTTIWCAPLFLRFRGPPADPAA